MILQVQDYEYDVRSVEESITPSRQQMIIILDDYSIDISILYNTLKNIISEGFNIIENEIITNYQGYTIINIQKNSPYSEYNPIIMILNK